MALAVKIPQYETISQPKLITSHCYDFSQKWHHLTTVKYTFSMFKHNHVEKKHRRSLRGWCLGGNIIFPEDHSPMKILWVGAVPYHITIKNFLEKRTHNGYNRKENLSFHKTSLLYNWPQAIICTLKFFSSPFNTLLWKTLLNITVFRNFAQ